MTDNETPANMSLVIRTEVLKKMQTEQEPAFYAHQLESESSIHGMSKNAS